MRTVVVLACGLLGLLTVSGVTGASGTFAPTITFETSTTRATAHPDARITIDNSDSSENIQDLTLQMPDGFWGSLAAIETPCTSTDAYAGDCEESTRIGSVTATAALDDPDSDTHAKVVLGGGIYMTDPINPADPAGIAIAITPKVGGIEFDKIAVVGRVMTVNGDAPSGAAGQSIGPLKAIKAVVNGIPYWASDSEPAPGRYVEYKLNKIQIDLTSKLADSSDVDYRPPLLTNPSKCGDYSIKASATPVGGGADHEFASDYTVDQCDTSDFAPQFESTFTDAVVAASSAQGIKSTITTEAVAGQPFETSAMSEVRVNLPRSFGANYPAFGSASDRCPGGSAGYGDADGDGYVDFGGPTWFAPSICNIATRPQAKIGEMTLHTPLLPNPLKGNVYLINKTPLPWLGVDINGQIPGNPKGIKVALAGVTTLDYVDPSCTAAFCQSQIGVTFSALPDAPVSRVDLDLDMGDRTRPNNTTLSGQILQMADPDETCQEAAEITANFTAASGDVVGRVNGHQFSGCPAPVVAPTSGPWGQETSDTAPSFGFTYSGLGSKQWCGFDEFQANAVDCTGLSSTTPSAALADGAHILTIGDGASQNVGPKDGIVRGFAVNTPKIVDDVAPDTVLATVPTTLADTTPAFTFHAESSSGQNSFQCSIDDGAFLPCGSADGSDDHTYVLPDAQAFEPSSDVTHTVAVRAQDSQGNVDLTPDSASFKVELPFTPTTDIALTTSAARAHPEMTITIANDSQEDLKDYTLKLPDGLLGGLTGVAALCELADADSSACGEASRIGSVTARAVIDRSSVTTTGAVYLTRPRVAGDPAGLQIIFKPKLQEITFDPISVPARLKLRGQADGIDALTLDIPRSARSTIGEVSEFDLRSIVINLKDNPSAPQPLLTNPSACDAKAFDVSYSGYDGGAASYPIAFQATGCSTLSFAPQLQITQKDSASGGVPAASTNAKVVNVDFQATLTSDPAGAGIKSASLTLPKPLTIDVGHLPAPCLPEQADLKICPASSAIGSAVANSPLLTQPLTGTVYVLKSPGSLPRLLVALRGEIDVDITADNEFVNVNQILTTFAATPDVPLTSFSMNVNRFLRTQNSACENPPSAWNIVGAIGGHNGAASPVNIPLTFDCPQAFSPVFADSFKNRGNKSTWSSKVTAQSGQQIRKLTVKLPKGVKFNAKATAKKKLAKYVKVTADGRQVKAKCIKAKGSSLQVGFCGKRASVVSITFKKGALKVKTKKKKLKFKVTVVDSAGKKQRAKDVG